MRFTREGADPDRALSDGERTRLRTPSELRLQESRSLPGGDKREVATAPRGSRVGWGRFSQRGLPAFRAGSPPTFLFLSILSVLVGASGRGVDVVPLKASWGAKEAEEKLNAQLAAHREAVEKAAQAAQAARAEADIAFGY